MSDGKANRGGRSALDEIVGRLSEPGFAGLHPRAQSRATGSAHVNPELLAVSPPRSRYVRRWRRHAKHCQYCRNIFRYLGIGIG